MCNPCQERDVAVKGLNTKRQASSPSSLRGAGGEPERSCTNERPRRHRGDIMSVEKRSALMSRIKGRDTGPERAIAALLSAAEVSYETHAADLPGRPDFVFRSNRVVVLVDGDFWHGWRFPAWRDKLSPAWEAKIDGNRRRDARNMRRLRYQGWKVIRLWEHQITDDPDACVALVLAALAARVKHLHARNDDLC